MKVSNGDSSSLGILPKRKEKSSIRKGGIGIRWKIGAEGRGSRCECVNCVLIGFGEKVIENQEAIARNLRCPSNKQAEGTLIQAIFSTIRDQVIDSTRSE